MGFFPGVYIVANHKRAVVFYCLRYMQRRNRGQSSPLAAIFVGCYANVSVFSREIKETLPNISVLKIEGYGTGLIQGYNWYGGSG